MLKISAKQEGFGLILILIALLIIAFLYLSSLHLLDNRTKEVKENIVGTTSPIKKAKEVKNQFEDKEKEMLNYLNN